MPTHSETQYLPYSPRQCFNLVLDIARYPEFLPWCRAARVIDRKEGEMLGELVISFKHLTESYTSRVTFTPPDPAGGVGYIDVAQTKGPFAHLENRWVFSPADGGGTKIDFFLDFRFKTRLLDMLIGSLFTHATQKMVGAFRARAEELYGEKAV